MASPRHCCLYTLQSNLSLKPKKKHKKLITMELRTYSISVLFFSTAWLGLVSSQSDSCSVHPDGVVPSQNSSFHCHLAWPSEDFILRYFQNNSNLWNFNLSTPNTNAYVAVGFSTEGKMVGSSAMVGWVSADGVGVLKQYYLGATSPGEVAADQGRLRVVHNSTSIVSQSSRLYLAFQLNTSKPESRLIYSVGQRNKIPSNNILTQHRNKISTHLEYASGKMIRGRPYTGLRKAHGILNMLGWGITVVMGAMAARYLKQWDPIWFYSHTLIQSLGFILGASGVIAGFALEDFLDIAVNRHKTIGIFILMLGCLQVVAFLFRPAKTSKVRKYWTWYHSILGRLLIVLSIINVFYGIHVAHEANSWNVGYGVAFALLVVVAVCLETRMWMTK